MSESETFLARWARLKRAATLEMSGADEHAPVEALRAADASPAPEFDPAGLPSIELIDAATDIRPFLETCVPEELRRAALRSAWSADPAIRDFIGIAESQWDFNDPATIPGFGAHAAADYLCSLAPHGLGSLNTGVESPDERSPMRERQLSEGTASAGSCATDAPGGDDRAAEPFAQPSASEGDPGARMARAHGGALPR